MVSRLNNLFHGVSFSRGGASRDAVILTASGTACIVLLQAGEQCEVVSYKRVKVNNGVLQTCKIEVNNNNHNNQHRCRRKGQAALQNGGCLREHS